MELCDDGTQNHQWEERDLYCETCGEHSGFSCTVCFEQVDIVWDQNEYARINMELNK